MLDVLVIHSKTSWNIAMATFALFPIFVIAYLSLLSNLYSKYQNECNIKHSLQVR